MRATVRYLPFLCWIFVNIECCHNRGSFNMSTSLAWTDDCEEQLLIASDEKLLKFCPETRETKDLALGNFRRISHSPKDGGTMVAFRGGQFLTFVQTHSANDTWTPGRAMDIKTFTRPCDAESADSLYDMAVDWPTGIVYATYSECGKIRAYDLKGSLFGLVHEDPHGHPRSIETYSRGGLLIWVQKSSILRAHLDGTEIRVLVEFPEYSVNILAVDQNTSLVYWSRKNQFSIFECDLRGENRRTLPLSAPPNHFTVLGSIMFLNEETTSVKRADGRFQRFAPSLQDERFASIGHLINDLEILPGPGTLDDSIENPCKNNHCSHICVQSSNRTGHTCLYPDDYTCEGDSSDCTFVRRRLLVSTTMEGIFQIPILNNSASEPHLVVNASSASSVQCDPARRKIFWSQTDEQSTRIWQVGMENSQTDPQIVFEHFLTFRASHEELEAFAVDWMTGNLYMAFEGEQRILACGRDNESTKYSKCAELFGNRVGSNIGALAVGPVEGTVYWTRMDEGDPAVMRGGMDGSWMEILKKGGQPKSLAIDALFRVYWLNHAPEQFRYFHSGKIFGSRDSFRPLQYKSYAPQRITIDGNDLYWAGRYKGSSGSSEALFKARFDKYGKLQDHIERHVEREFTNVTGLWMCDADFEWTRRAKTCACGCQCDGLCLLSGRNSFRCVCPIGFESRGTNGSSCEEIEEPPVIYSIAKERVNGSMKMKDGINEKLIYEGPVSSMAFDPVRRQLFWCCDRDLRHGQVNRTLRIVLRENQSGVNVAPEFFYFQFVGPSKEDWAYSPRRLEYDWIGENLFFLNSLGEVGLCSTVGGECTITLLSSVRSIALDPPNGYMYWALWPPVGIWRGEMDGSGGTLIISQATAEALTIDHTSKLLFWQYQEDSATEVFHSDLDGRNIKSIIRLHARGSHIRVAGNRLWMNFVSYDRNVGGILGCDKETGDNLKTLKMGDYNWGDRYMTGLVIVEPPMHVRTDKDVCIQGGLCSHMCIPTPSGYMRCLCPTGYKLSSNGWNCECADANICKESNSKQPALRPSQTNAYSKKTTQVVCQGDEFSCVGVCLGVGKLCNGFPDCQDVSDEGERCSEACEDEDGCSHECSRSPTGSICFCPPNQMLANDNKSCVVLKIRNEPVHEGKLKVGLIFAGVLGLAFVIVIILGTLKYQQTKRERELTQEELDEFMRGDPAAAVMAPDGVDRALLLPYTKLILPEDIIIAKDTKLGSGEFGVVHPGICRFEPVAIKLLKHSVDVEEFKAVLAEVKIMAYLGDHEFIVKFVGAEISEISKRKIMIVTELSPKGDLLKFLWKVASVHLETPFGMPENTTGNASDGTNLMLYSWCEQIATGMEYLAQKQIVHGDLAARNILVFKDNVVKIADFGLSKQLYGCSTYQMKRERKLPWKWSAIELLTSREFSEASDVWAFGVTAWEIFTLGQTPYKGIMIGNQFIDFIQRGNRLPKPEHASEEIYKVLLECWDSERSNRPNFNRLKQIFQDFVSEQRGCMQPLVNTEGSEYLTAV